MSDIKWIKLTVDMFDNRKIKHLRKLPEGNAIVLVWVMLLTMAGRCNASGMIFLTENIPYTPKMLADELDIEESIIVLALEALEQLNMIFTDNGIIAISNWEEYQNIDGMEKIKEQTRQRVAKHREKLKNLPSNVTCNVTVTQCNATEKEIDIDIDKEYINNICSTLEVEPAQNSNNNSKQLTEEELKNFQIIRNLYPKGKNNGVTKAKDLYRQWIRTGKTVNGKKVKLENIQIWYAVKDYLTECEEKGTPVEYIKNIDTLLGASLMDYVRPLEECRERKQNG